MPTPGLTLLNQFYGSSGIPNFFQAQGQTPIAQTTPGTTSGSPASTATGTPTGTGTQAQTATTPTVNPWGASPWTKGTITRLGNPWTGNQHQFGYLNSGVRPGERNAIASFLHPSVQQGNAFVPQSLAIGNFNPYPYLYGNAGGQQIPTSGGMVGGSPYQNMFRPAATGEYFGNYISPTEYLNLSKEFEERNLTDQFNPFLANPVNWMTEHVLPTVVNQDPTAVAQAGQLNQEEFVNLLTQALEAINAPLHTIHSPYNWSTGNFQNYAQAEQWIPQLNQVLSRLGLA